MRPIVPRATSAGLLLAAAALAAPANAGFWSRNLREALRDVREGGEVEWILAYFPSPGADRDPRELEELATAKKLEGLIIGATVTADEVVEAVVRYRVTRFPSLLLLTPDGQVADRWERRWTTQDVLTDFQTARRRYRRYLEELDELLASAERAAESGKDRVAIAACHELKERSPAGSRFHRRADELLAGYEQKVERALLETLALEGLISDYRVQRELLKIEDLYPLESTERLVAAQIHRLKTRKIGGRR